MSETEEKGEAGGERVDHKEEAKQFQEQVAALKMKKQKAKCAFTRQKNRLFDYLLDYSTDRDLLKETLDKLENEMDIAVDIMNGLMDCYIQAGKTKDMERTANETEKIQEEYENLAQRYRQFLSLSNPDNHNGNVKNTETVSVKNSEKTIELDLSKNIKRVSVPTFYGEKTKYSSWKAAFTACIDNSQATPEYKLLHLRDSLRGRALKAIESLGHSAAAYEAAKERLERKFGGERRQVNRFLEELSNFPTIKYENAKIIERFADLLDIALINMKDTDTDTKSNFMYLQVMKKMTESMVTRYQRWIYENEEEESMETLKEWVVKESEFYTIASEIKHGMDYDQKTERAEKSFYTEPQQKSCRFCSENHNIWQCESFKSLPEKSRWEKTKELNLCFRCLNVGHQGKHCKTHRKCGVNGCQKLHNRLLHTERQEPQQNQEFNVTAHCKTQSSFVALRTVPVTLKSGHKSLKVNALLDDGSTKSYINSDIAHELGLNGTVRNVSVNVLDGDIKTFETMPVTFRLESVDGNTAIKMDAFTTNKVTGNMKVIDWNAHANKFPHLRDIKFPRVDRSRPYVDILIGVDYPELHKSFTEIYGAPGEPYARLGPLGWTCIGQPYNSDQGVYMTYFQQENIGEVLRGFWEIESSGTGKTENKIVSPLDKQVMKETEKCLKFVDGRYEVAIPWKKHSELPDNREMALKRLKHTEKKLNQKPEVKKLYQSTIENYLEKQYIRKVETKTDNISKGGRWYLPHFPVVKPDRDTTKVRIVFDASAKCSDESLNDNIHEGPKLQNDLFHVLLRFRKYPVALVCDISEMYLQISLREEDRPFHRFLWNSDKDPPRRV